LSSTGLDRRAGRVGEIGELARWLSSDQAKVLEQEELDPKAPIDAPNRIDNSFRSIPAELR